jgi:polyisoprenoid-binding protein YceI
MQVMDLGFANIFGFFQNATGSFTFDEGNKSISKLRLAIDATSLVAGNPQNQRDFADLLGIAENPEIGFVAMDSTPFKDGKASIKGTLTLHGASKPMTLDATLNHAGKSPYGGGMWSSEGDALGLSMRGSIKRADFGMTDDPNMPTRFGDTIILQLEMQAIKQ